VDGILRGAVSHLRAFRAFESSHKTALVRRHDLQFVNSPTMAKISLELFFTSAREQPAHVLVYQPGENNFRLTRTIF